MPTWFEIQKAQNEAAQKLIDSALAGGARGTPSARFDVNNPFAPTTDPHGAFGTVPKDVPMPNPFGDLSSIYPNLAAANAAVSGNVESQLAGELSPATQAAIQDAAARFGVTSGMPGSGLARNRTVRDLGLTTEAIQDQGLKNYLAAINQISATQTVNPTLQTEINTTNTLNRAAPNPTDAANYSKTLFDQYLQTLRGPGGGTGLTNAPAVWGGAGVPSTSSGGGNNFRLPTPSTGGNAFRPSTPSTPNAGTGFMQLTSTTPGGFQFEIPENWGLFSSAQQSQYPAQIDWARQFANAYE